MEEDYSFHPQHTWKQSSGNKPEYSSWVQSIREKLGVQNIVKEIKQYLHKWLQHVQRMDTNRIPKQALQYMSKGRRNI
jgi:hypothetical protein